ncbi:MAG: hypothetical protein ACPG51_19925 [Thiolinea sp.]
MMQDDYSGLTRAYTTAPVLAIDDIQHRLKDANAAVDVAADAIIKQNSIESDNAETVLKNTVADMWVLLQELKHLTKQLKEGSDDE